MKYPTEVLLKTDAKKKRQSNIEAIRLQINGLLERGEFKFKTFKDILEDSNVLGGSITLAFRQPGT